jgi:hypothetical protein
VGLNSNALTVKVNALASAATWISAHTADPGTTGTSEVTGGSYARQQTTWGAASGSGPVTRAGTQVTIPIPSGTTVTHFGLFTAVTGGTFEGFVDSADEVFGSGGNLLVTPTLSDG